MKQLSKDISHLLMKLDACETDREEFNTILEFERLIKKAKLDMSCDKEGYSYFDECNEILLTDIVEYLNEFKEHYNCPGWKHYTFEKWKNSRGCWHLYTNILTKGVLIKSSKLEDAVRQFRKYNVCRVLKFDKKYEGEFYKKTKYLTKDEYEEFIKIREETPKYFLPYITEILELMCEMRVKEK